MFLTPIKQPDYNLSFDVVLKERFEKKEEARCFWRLQK